MRASVLNQLVADGLRRAARMEPRLAAALTPVLERAGNQAATAFTQRATNHLTAAQRQADAAIVRDVGIDAARQLVASLRLRAAADVTAQSTMVCVKPRPDEAQTLADPDGEPPDLLHVTLVYIGETDGPLQPIADAVAGVAASHAPLSGIVGGYGQFGTPGDAPPVGVLLPDVPGLVELRVAVTEALAAKGIDYARNHGFEAHITVDTSPELGEGDEELPRAYGQPLHFDQLLVVRGDTEVISMPLIGRPPVTAAGEPPPWSAPAPDELLDVQALIASLRTKIDPVRLAVAKTMQTSAFSGWKTPKLYAATQADLDLASTWGEIAREAVARAEAAKWSGDRILVTRDAAGHANAIVAILGDGAPEGYLKVYRLAAAAEGSGAGRPMMSAVARLAASEGKGVEVASSLRAQGFYEKIGMRKDGGRYYWTEKDVKEQLAGDLASGLSFDVTNPFTARLFERTASQVTHIADTTQLNVMRIIRESYEQGLSIPDTAKAIRVGMHDATPARARLIARTELVGAVNGGSLAAMQIVGAATDTAYTKTWLTAPGAKDPRHELYEDLDGQTVPLDGMFNVGGFELAHPGDPNGPPEEVCNCFPGETSVIAPGTQMGFRRRYDGWLHRVETDGGHVLAGTPNHPVLTDVGWQRLGDLVEGDRLVCGTLREDEAAAAPDVQHAPAAIEEVFGALARRGVPRRIRGGAVQFHGDGLEGEVKVVAADGALFDHDTAARLDPPLENKLVRGREPAAALAPSGFRADLVVGDRLIPASRISSGSEGTTIVWTGLAHADGHRGRPSAQHLAVLDKPQPDGRATDAERLGERLLGGAVAVSLTEVVGVEIESFHGDVFNLQTASGAYLAGGIIAHNCRCAMSFTDAGGEGEQDADEG